MNDEAVSQLLSLLGGLSLFCGGYVLAEIRAMKKNGINPDAIGPSSGEHPLVSPDTEAQGHTANGNIQAAPLHLSAEEDGEITRLKRALEEREGTIAKLKEQIQQLDEEVATLRSLGLTYEAPPKPIFIDPQHLEGRLAAKLGQLSSEWPENRGLVLADKRGRRVAGVGKQGQIKGLAALGAIFHELTVRLPKLTQLTKLHELTFSERSGGHKVTIVMVPLAVRPEQIYLVARYLGEGTVPPAFQRLCEELPQQLEVAREGFR